MSKKQQKSIGLSPDVIDFIERNRGHLSFSAFAELLIREGMRILKGEEEEVEGIGEPRRRIIRVR
jgi:hypothetical protein